MDEDGANGTAPQGESDMPKDSHLRQKDVSVAEQLLWAASRSGWAVWDTSCKMSNDAYEASEADAERLLTALRSLGLDLVRTRELSDREFFNVKWGQDG